MLFISLYTHISKFKRRNTTLFEYSVQSIKFASASPIDISLMIQVIFDTVASTPVASLHIHWGNESPRPVLTLRLKHSAVLLRIAGHKAGHGAHAASTPTCSARVRHVAPFHVHLHWPTRIQGEHIEWQHGCQRRSALPHTLRPATEHERVGQVTPTS